MALTFADGTVATQDVELVAGDAVFLDVTVQDESDKSLEDLSIYTDAVWVLEQVEGEIRKTVSGGQIIKTGSLLRVPIAGTETSNLHGLYTHQLRLISSQNEPSTILSGTALVKPQVFV